MKKTLGLLFLSILSFQSFAENIEIIERVKLENGGYTVWSDGYIEQWGYKKPEEDQVVFHIPYTEEKTISFIMQEYISGDTYGLQPTKIPIKTGVYDFNRHGYNGTWMSEGY